MVAMLLATVILTFLKGPSSVPLWFDLIMRGAALLHPTREVFALDRPGRENLILGLFIAGGLVLFVLPEIALLLAP